MNARNRRRRHEGGTGVPGAPLGRVFVVRRTALGYRALVHHPYGRLTRLGPPSQEGRADFAERDQVARAVAREALRRSPEAAELRQVVSLLGGPGPRWELPEEAVRAAAARAARLAA